MGAFVEVVGLDVDAQRHLPSGARGERVRDAFEPARDQREEVARLGEGVLPHHVAEAVAEGAALDLVPVREHHREAARVPGDAGAVARHHVRAVGEPGDLPEPLRLALRAQVPRRGVEPFEGLVLAGPDRHLGLQHERIGGVADRQRLGGDLDPVPRHRLAVDAHRAGVESPPVEDQIRRGCGGGRGSGCRDRCGGSCGRGGSGRGSRDGCGSRGGCGRRDGCSGVCRCRGSGERGRDRGVAPYLELRPHQRAFLAELEVEVHFIDEEGRRSIVRESGGGGFGGAHRGSSLIGERAGAALNVGPEFWNNGSTILPLFP